MPRDLLNVPPLSFHIQLEGGQSIGHHQDHIQHRVPVKSAPFLLSKRDDTVADTSDVENPVVHSPETGDPPSPIQPYKSPPTETKIVEARVTNTSTARYSRQVWNAPDRFKPSVP